MQDNILAFHQAVLFPIYLLVFPQDVPLRVALKESLHIFIFNIMLPEPACNRIMLVILAFRHHFRHLPLLRILRYKGVLTQNTENCVRVRVLRFICQGLSSPDETYWESTWNLYPQEVHRQDRREGHRQQEHHLHPEEPVRLPHRSYPVSAAP